MVIILTHKKESQVMCLIQHSLYTVELGIELSSYSFWFESVEGQRGRKSEVKPLNKMMVHN